MSLNNVVWSDGELITASKENQMCQDIKNWDSDVHKQYAFKDRQVLACCGGSIFHTPGGSEIDNRYYRAEIPFYHDINFPKKDLSCFGYAESGNYELYIRLYKRNRTLIKELYFTTGVGAINWNYYETYGSYISDMDTISSGQYLLAFYLIGPSGDYNVYAGCTLWQKITDPSIYQLT